MPRFLLLLLPLLVCLLVCMTSVEAQIIGPDTTGAFYFYYNNYSAVYLLRTQPRLRPSVEFHPVLGGVEDPFIRLQNWATFNFTNIQEKNGNTIVEQLNPMDMTWKLTTSSDTDPKTGNFHTVGNLSATAPNGAQFAVICETWSLGITKAYGTLNSTVAPGETEVSLQIANWPFRSMNNTFRVTMHVGLDGPLINIPFPTSPTRYQRSLTVSSQNTTFTATLWTEGILDGVMTHFDYDPRGIFTSDLILESKAFKSTYFYDPNLQVLLNTQPDCSKLSNCGGHGTCVDDNVCKCKRFYIQPDCVTFKDNATSSEENPNKEGSPVRRPSSNRIATPVIIGVSVGACVAVVAAVAIVLSVRHARTRGRTRKMTESLQKNAM